MFIEAIIHHVKEFTGNSKRKAEVSMIVEEPAAMISIALFETQMNDGTYRSFKELEGKAVMVPVSVDQYQGRIQYQLPFGATPRVAKPVKAVG